MLRLRRYRCNTSVGDNVIRCTGSQGNNSNEAIGGEMLKIQSAMNSVQFEHVFTLTYCVFILLHEWTYMQ